MHMGARASPEWVREPGRARQQVATQVSREQEGPLMVTARDR